MMTNKMQYATIISKHYISVERHHSTYFHQCRPEQIKSEILSEAVAYYKGKEGRGVMSDALREYAKEYAKEYAREYGEEQKKAGIKEGQLELLVKFFRNNGTEVAAKQMLDASDEDIKIAKERLVSLS